MTGAGAEEAGIGVFIIKMSLATTGGSRGTTSQGPVAMQRPEVMRIVGLMRTEEAGERSWNLQSTWTALGGHLPRVGLYGGHCLQMYRTIIPKEKEGERADGADKRTSKQQLQSLLNQTLPLRPCQVTHLSRYWCLHTLSSFITTLLSPGLEVRSQ